MKRDSVKEGRWSWLLDDDRVMRDFLMKFVEACERRRVSPEAVRCLVDPVDDLADPRRYNDVWDALGDRVSSDWVARVLTPNVITLPQDLTANAFMALVQEKLEREGFEFEVDSTLAEMLADGSVYPWFGPGACLEWSLWTPSRTLNGRDWGVKMFAGTSLTTVSAETPEPFSIGVPSTQGHSWNHRISGSLQPFLTLGDGGAMLMAPLAEPFSYEREGHSLFLPMSVRDGGDLAQIRASSAFVQRAS
ncbi:hypothetical protein KBD13_00145 [Patescibacteria group bacterium]|nr:hypothetical protein [Patescibacteria group bacterium]